MITPQIQAQIDHAEDSHRAAKTLLDEGFSNFSAAQSYYTMFYLTEALLYSIGYGFLKVAKKGWQAGKKCRRG